MRGAARGLLLVSFVCALCVAGFSLDRDAFTFVNYDLQVKVNPEAKYLAAEGKVVLRNDSQTPQKNLTLQISSSLQWTGIRVDGREVLYAAQPYQSDVDHTGAVNEAVITLPTAVGPNQTVEVEVSYGGVVVDDSTRLTRIGTPLKVALENDWDQIKTDFTAVRGVGYVCWYPVSMEPANLSEGNRYFDVIGEWKRRNAGASMKLALELVGPGSIIANGRLTGVTARQSENPDEPAIRVNQYLFAPIGAYVPTFAAGNFESVERPAVSVAYLSDEKNLPGHKAAAEEFANATEQAVPWVQEWFGPVREKVRVVELANANALPFDSGTMVFTPLKTSDPRRVQVQMAHQLAHASLAPGVFRPWISEGLAQFAQALVREKQDGRKAALAWMNGFIPALVSAEEQSVALSQASASPAQAKTGLERGTEFANPAQAKSGLERGTGQSLINATDPAYYNIKAMFVWWMLRDILGDQALGRAIRAYDPAKDKDAAAMQKLVEAESKKQLEWFFDDWVYRDRGLPDFKISAGFVRPVLQENSAEHPAQVTITVENMGDAAAEVPLVIRTGKGDVTSRVMVGGKSKSVQRMQVPADPTTALVNDGSVPEANVTNNVYTFGKSQSQ